jgi:hypothetical protein
VRLPPGSRLDPDIPGAYVVAACGVATDHAHLESLFSALSDTIRVEAA